MCNSIVYLPLISRSLGLSIVSYNTFLFITVIIKMHHIDEIMSTVVFAIPIQQGTLIHGSTVWKESQFESFCFYSVEVGVTFSF